MVTQTARQLARRFSKDQRGITGLETAIVLVAFVLVASVFAYAVLNTGLFASDRSKQSVIAGLRQAESTVETRGAVTAEQDGSTTNVYSIHFVLANAPGGDAISLAKADLAVNYSDGSQLANLSDKWDVTWLVSTTGVFPPTNMMMQPGDVVQMNIDVKSLTTKLGANTPFTIEVHPKVGSVITVSRTTPAAITKAMNLG